MINLVNRFLTLPTIILQQNYLSFIMSKCCSFRSIGQVDIKEHIMVLTNLAMYVVGNLSIFFKGKAANDWPFIIDMNSSLDKGQ